MKTPFWIRFFFGQKKMNRWRTYETVDSPWAILCRFVAQFYTCADLFSIALACLKLCGLISVSWWIVILPTVIKATVILLANTIEYIAKSKQQKYEEQIYAEEARKYKESIKKKEELEEDIQWTEL